MEKNVFVGSGHVAFYTHVEEMHCSLGRNIFTIKSKSQPSLIFSARSTSVAAPSSSPVLASAVCFPCLITLFLETDAAKYSFRCFNPIFADPTVS